MPVKANKEYKSNLEKSLNSNEIKVNSVSNGQNGIMALLKMTNYSIEDMKEIFKQPKDLSAKGKNLAT